ncbi:MAG: PQQ-binding-like beta-propeller repeat protein [Gemmataceae bacterium]|nr:PQQ-binding-like beta-propeller repeat protein [Gemmataceae bacterium]
MRRASFALLALLLFAASAPAVILKLTPLKDVLDGEQLIFVATVEKLDPEKPAVVLKFAEKLKGDVPFEALPVNLSGDAEAKKGGHAKVILDRLDPARMLIVFATKDGNVYHAMAFTEGTWFSLRGTVGDDGKAVRWAFLHAEPYLRRTFKGTTAELKKVVEDGLAGKAEPPKPNDKEPPGYGPPVEKKCGMRNAECGIEGPQPQAALGLHSAFRVPHAALFGVIPSFVLVGPLALVAALFPGVAARLAVGMRRWRAFLVVAGVNSTLALVYWLVRDQGWLPDLGWVVSYQGFTALLLLSTAVGLVWAGRRYRRMAADDPAATALPRAGEVGALAGLAAFVGVILVVARLLGGSWAAAALDLPMREFTLIGLGLVAALGYAGYRVLTRRSDGADPAVRLSLSGEAVGLGVLLLGGVVALLVGGDRPSSAGAIAAAEGGGFDPGQRRIKLAGVRLFEVPAAHQVMSGVAVAGDRLYFGTAKRTGFRESGAVVALDRHTGREAWAYADGVRPVFCTPNASGGRVYCGEGLHTDAGCRLLCLDAETGKPAWPQPFETGSHTEGRPWVEGGRVYFTAGDDGLYCADAATGARVWQFAGKDQGFHVDGPAAVAGGRVFLGSGLYTPALLAVDAASGKELWRSPQPLRSFGPPLVLGDTVVYGLGTGNLVNDVFEYAEEGKPAEAAPAGAVVCVSAADGKEVWRRPLPRPAHTPLAADGLFVYAACRDGAVYCLSRRTGAVRWSLGLGSPLTAGVAAAADADGVPVAVYAVSPEGRVVCLSPYTGKVMWSRDLREDAGGRLVEEVASTPAVVADGSGRAVYVGAQLRNRNTGAKTAAVFRLDDEAGE